MKNTLKKFVISTLIGATAATAVIAPMAAPVFASDWEVVEIEDDAVPQDTYSDEEFVLVDIDEGRPVDSEYVVVEVEDSNQSCQRSSQEKKKATAKLDKSLYGETRYADVSDFLALRSRATSDSREIARLAPNTKMTIIGTTGNWVKVYVPSIDKDGFVYNQYVSKTMR